MLEGTHQVPQLFVFHTPPVRQKQEHLLVCFGWVLTRTCWSEEEQCARLEGRNPVGQAVICQLKQGLRCVVIELLLEVRGDWYAWLPLLQLLWLFSLMQQRQITLL